MSLYPELLSRLTDRLRGERNFIANAANTAALIYQNLPDVNWAGFYILRNGELVLGPFQGKPAVTRIPLGRGVCGSVVRTLQTVVVENVHDCRDHIACDAASNSEIVIPILNDGALIAVLDIDSPLRDRFRDADRAGLESLVEAFVAATDVERT